MNNQVVANVGGNAIFAYEVDEMVAAYAQRGQNYDNPQGRAAILDQIINKKLLLLDAKKNLMEHNAEFKAELERVKEEMLANFNVQKAVENVTATEEDAKAYYEAHKEQFQKGESVSASHILVDSEEKANEIKAKIDSGEISFEDAARENSSCPSGKSGGALGEFTRGQMVPEFDSAAFAAEIGVVSGPVKSQFGYHLIKVTEKNAASEIAFDQVKDQVKSMALTEKRQKALNSKINQLKILYPVDKL